MKNQAMVMTDVRKFELQDVPMPKVGADEVGIAVKRIGICGSDMGFFDGKAFSIFPDSLPFILGHEGAGVVYEVGENVKNLKVGDRVAMEPGVPCGKCEFCESGRYNLCPDVVFMATPPVNGCMRRYISHPAHKTYKLPDNMSFTEGAPTYRRVFSRVFRSRMRQWHRRSRRSAAADAFWSEPRARSRSSA